ncbi:hypothetical protein KP509_22G012800 [Ceratopteris richardii]|nr:hypothetical protein KP509_22G012800 [Ceratopteris richardii]
MYYSNREDPEPLLLAGCTVRRLMNGLAFPVQRSSACAVFRSYRGNGMTLQYARPVQFYGHCSAFGNIEDNQSKRIKEHRDRRKEFKQSKDPTI